MLSVIGDQKRSAVFISVDDPLKACSWPGQGVEHTSPSRFWASPSQILDKGEVRRNPSLFVSLH